MKKLLLIFLTGTGMGACDIVPGVSGGTIAFITGIYRRLIDSIAAFDAHALHLLLNGRLGCLFRYVDGAFLLALVSGIGVSIMLLSSVMTWALGAHPAIVYSFFIGLIIASAYIIAQNIMQWSWSVGLLLVLGVAIGLILGHLVPTNVINPSRWMIMGAAAIAICAMILPGISGSFLLLIMGMYEVTLQAIHQRDITYLLLFVGGAALGLLSFVRVVRRAFTRHHDVTVGLLLGLMIGSLPQLFPRSIEQAPSFADGLAQGGAAIGGLVVVLGVQYWGRMHPSLFSASDDQSGGL